MGFQLPMPCKNVSACFPCNDLPGTNKSSEAQDVLQDFSIQWGNLQTNTPPLGSLFSANGCAVLCVSSLSQEDAFLCAQRSQVLCVTNNWNPTPQDPPVCLNFPCAPVVPPQPPETETFGNQPEACTVPCPDGAPYTFAVAAGSFLATNPILANRMATSFACREALLHKVCLTLASPFVCLGSESTLTFVATGRSLDSSSNFWEFRGGTLPTGFTFTNTNAGPVLTITGVPTALGDFSFSIRVTAPDGDFAERTFTVSCIGIATDEDLPDAAVGADYDETLTQVGIDGASWFVTDGALPDGLTLDPATGEITGQPTEDGDFSFTVLASNGEQTCTKRFFLTVVGCFIDASPNSNLANFGQPLARNGGLASFTDQSVFVGWYYLDHTFQANPLNLGAGHTVLNTVCAAGRYIAGQDLTAAVNFWIDLTTNTIRNIGHQTFGEAPTGINDNGDLALSASGSASWIYTAATNTFSGNLFTLDGFNIEQLNNARASTGTKIVAGQPHAFLRSSTGVYTDIHPLAGGFSQPGGSSGQYQKKINSAAHVAGAHQNGVAVRVFANFGAGSILLTGVITGVNQVIINDLDQVAWDNSGTGHVFIYSGVALDIGNLGVLQGFNNSGIAVGQDTGNTKAWIYANGVVSDLITKIPSAVSNGWTSIIFVYDISDDNFVTGIGIQNGNPTFFVAKVCV